MTYGAHTFKPSAKPIPPAPTGNIYQTGMYNMAPNMPDPVKSDEKPKDFATMMS
jgi:hypothetical protein